MRDEKAVVTVLPPIGGWPDCSNHPMWNTPEAKAQILLCAKSLADRIDAELSERVYREWIKREADV